MVDLPHESGIKLIDLSKRVFLGKNVILGKLQ
jgi:hypothetical protein